MLKNRQQRIEYLYNDDNWDYIDVIKHNDKELFKLYKLKDLNIYKIKAHYDATPYMPEHWNTYGDLFRLSEEGLYQTYVNQSEALEIIRKA